MARKEKRYHYIYKTTNILTDKYYIGMHSTDNLEDGYIGSGKRLWYSVKKYGKENHKVEILEFLPNRRSLIEREISIVNEDLLKEELCMNMRLGGEGGYIKDEYTKKGRVMADKVLKDKYGDNFRGIVSKNYYNNLSEVERYKLTNKIKDGLKESGFNHKSFLGKKHKEESKQKIGLANSTHQKGKNNSQYGTCWITNGSENKKVKKTDILPENWWCGRTF